MMDVKSYTNLAQTVSKGKGLSAADAMQMSAKTLGTYVTNQFVGELMKNMPTNTVIGGGFAEDMYKSYMVQAISEQIGAKDGFGFEKLFHKKLNVAAKKEKNHESIDIVI